MGWIYAVCVLAVVFVVWSRGAARLEQAGRGWFVRHWISSVAGLFMGAIVALLFYADAWWWNALGLAVTVLAIRAWMMPAAGAASPESPSP